MKTLPRGFGCLVITIFSCVQIPAALVDAAPPAGFRLTVELRDGSRIIGKSKNDIFQFRSDTLGDINLSLGKIRSVESLAKTNFARLTTVSADSLTIEYAMAEIRVDTAYGQVELPVSLIKNMRVSVLGKGRPSDGLIGLWSGEGNAVDSVGGNNGVLQNVRFTDGVAGQAFSFQPDNFPYGTYTGVQIPDKPAYELTHSLTIEGWIRPRAHAAYVIFFRGDHRPGLDPYCLSMDGNQNLVFTICADNDHIATAKTPVDLGAWIHVAGVLDDNTGTVSLYTNGVLAAQTPTTVRPFGALQADQSPGIGIGNVNDGGNNFPFSGEIDEIGLYDRALSEAEVTGIYAEHAADAGSRAELLPQRTNQNIRPVFIRNGIPVYNSD
jgi:hypothetical protein